MYKNILLRLVTYYVAVILLLVGLLQAFPILGQLMAAERARQGGRAALEPDRLPESLQGTTAYLGTMPWLEAERTIPILLSLILALAVALPVVWVYRWTRPRRRYNQALAQTLLVVPIAITLVVFLVKDSLALAFSLAGIVAAVRFRTTLDEPLDAVYLFLVIGTGLAAGVQLLFVALIASIMFNAVTLTVWRLNLGGQPALLEGWWLVETGPAGQIPDAGGVVASASAGSTDESGGPCNARLSLHVTEVEAAQRCAISILEERAKAWRVAGVGPDEDGRSVIEFDLRLKKSVDLAAFIKEIEQSDPHVTRVEFVRSKSKKPKEE